MTLPKNILVATDFSDSATDSLELALELAKALEARVTVLHAYEIPFAGFPDAMFFITAETAARVQKNIQMTLDETVKRHADRGVELSSMLRFADPREAILDASAEIGADLIVMGTHGRRGLARALLGSVAEHVVRASPRPVMTVRAPQLHSRDANARAAPQ